MFCIKKKFHFEAGHYLRGLPEGHQCGNQHGHGYVVEIELWAGELNEHGFVVDYGELKPMADYLSEKFDHRNLNDEFAFQPTAENIAHHLYMWARTIWPEVHAVRVSETKATWAEYNQWLDAATRESPFVTQDSVMAAAVDVLKNLSAQLERITTVRPGDLLSQAIAADPTILKNRLGEKSGL